MAGPAQSPLQRYLAVQKPLDAQMRVLLREAAAEAERLVAAYGDKETFGKTRMRRAVSQLKKVSLDTWGEVEGITDAGIKKAASAAALSERWMQGVLKDRFGAELPDWDKALGYSAENGITALLAKQKNAIPLSRRVYKAQAWTDANLEKTIQRGILLQKSAKEIAKDVKGFIDPKVPGGVSSAAFRLGRTEINNAFHTQQIDSRESEPWTEAFQWYLSGSHRVPDKCNQYADQEHFQGGGKGVFQKGAVPGKPHPNCLCYLTTVTTSEDEFVDSFLTGKYDSYLNERLGELPESEATAPSPPSAATAKPRSFRKLDKDSVKSFGKEIQYTQDQQDAIFAYSMQGFENINGYLRTGHSSFDPDQVRSWIGHLDSAMRPSPEDVIIRRYVSPEVLPGLKKGGKKQTEKALKELTGQTFEDSGYLSTGLVQSLNGFQANLEIEIPKGTRSINISKSGISEFSNEYELLLDKNTRLIVTEAFYDEDDILIIKMRAVKDK